MKSSETPEDPHLRRRAFGRTEIAEDEIERAQRRHSEEADAIFE